jgi:hypothetical protein
MRPSVDKRLLLGRAVVNRRPYGTAEPEYKEPLRIHLWSYYYHLTIRMAVAKSTRMVGRGARGRSL